MTCDEQAEHHFPAFGGGQYIRKLMRKFTAYELGGGQSVQLATWRKQTWGAWRPEKDKYPAPPWGIAIVHFS